MMTSSKPGWRWRKSKEGRPFLSCSSVWGTSQPGNDVEGAAFKEPGGRIFEAATGG